jgi:Lon protease-like protein
MPRPIKPYGRRSVSSYDRDTEYLLRLRAAIWRDHSLDSTKASEVMSRLDALLEALRDLQQDRAANE